MANQSTILIADDDKDLVRSLATRCRQRNLNVLTAYTGLDAVKMADDHSPDLLCLDVNMPCGNGLGACEMLMTHQRLAATPIIIMTGNADEDTIRRCHSLCAYYVEKCPNVWQRLEPLIEELLGLQAQPQDGDPAKRDPRELPVPDHMRLQVSNRKLIDVVFAMLGADSEYLDHASSDSRVRAAGASSDRSRPWILCIDDDADYSMALKLRLETHGFQVERAFEGMGGFRQAFGHPADAILLDYEMPNGQGDYILERLKDNPVTKNIPVLVITGRQDPGLERTMLNLGAAQFLTKPIDFTRLLAELERAIAPRADREEVRGTRASGEEHSLARLQGCNKT